MGVVACTPSCYHARIMAHVQNLFCEENFIEDLVVTPRKHNTKQRLFVAANKDETLMSEKVLNNILLDETPFCSEDYFLAVQTSILPHMRKIVTDWIVEVCEDQQCHQEVFFLSINYLDRFLSKVNIKKTQFQMIASICLLLASKMVSVCPLSISQLVTYSDYSVTEQELVEGELLVLTVLGWELSTITPVTVYNTIKHRIGEHDSNTVNTILTISATHHQFSLLSPSLVVAATITATHCHLLPVLARLTQHTERDVEHLATFIRALIGDQKQSKIDTEERPNTPEDILNISQQEISV